VGGGFFSSIGCDCLVFGCLCSHEGRFLAGHYVFEYCVSGGTGFASVMGHCFFEGGGIFFNIGFYCGSSVHWWAAGLWPSLLIATVGLRFCVGRFRMGHRVFEFFDFRGFDIDFVKGHCFFVGGGTFFSIGYD
jgi:hypothetical protein